MSQSLGKSGGSSVEKGVESDVENWHLQGDSLRLCWLKTGPRASIQHTDHMFEI
jgi:hypothetical protein